MEPGFPFLITLRKNDRIIGSTRIRLFANPPFFQGDWRLYKRKGKRIFLNDQNKMTMIYTDVRFLTGGV